MKNIYWGDNLKFLRKKKIMTQKQLGDRLEMNSNNISHWEKGNFPNVGIVLKMREILDVNLHDLFLLEMRKSKKYNSNINSDLLRMKKEYYVDEIESMQQENELLKSRLKDKEEIIELLRSKLGKG